MGDTEFSSSDLNSPHSNLLNSPIFFRELRICFVSVYSVVGFYQRLPHRLNKTFAK